MVGLDVHWGYDLDFDILTHGHVGGSQPSGSLAFEILGGFSGGCPFNQLKASHV